MPGKACLSIQVQVGLTVLDDMSSLTFQNCLLQADACSQTCASLALPGGGHIYGLLKPSKLGLHYNIMVLKPTRQVTMFNLAGTAVAAA